ncbi:UDP-N-acetylmuramoyl-tripeptide--D-alanyl-D-alanine ligase [Aggregatimonas sangjinii]|uniref:UDP-N-acetylmuramoyl-tripeptide--D-alanyl-D-alanine ligase n=1 Tax=Aggregatimonas sangjinii TaxID=2583587 RepID=A0A5B7SYU0_9FLAO|nr:UDP-N-acetylmuramoyl-tripeptide--D-alanyl-D-alanine ligase [Aggregatimonas sangjinii]QCX02248.1 UDP-N-acetylmuramoyl-tripeptide--D-alanyl-D-alanine ligase [Aggregatimonas sangjinii]
MTITQLHHLFLAHPIVSTDTRKIEEHCIFFALKGDNFNGNEYAAQALEKGAAYAVVDEEKYHTSDRTILVGEVLTALQELACFHRNHCEAKIIGLTGSNGKTTTKELINTVLAKKYRTVATKGNLNNHIGVPLTLLSIMPDTEIAIVEMGANHQKEIAFLCEIAQPDFGYVTNFGKAHLEGFGGVEGVIKGKSELYDYLIANGKSVFMNADDSIQLEKLGSYIRKYGFSTEKQDYFKIKLLGADPFVHLKAEDVAIQTKLIGSYNFTNCCAALLIGKYFNVPLTDIKQALENYVPDNNRSQLLEKNGHHIILDAYNANPTSMKAALENFATMEAKRKTAFLGDMFELGTTAPEEHQKIADLAADMKFEHVFLVGKNFDGTNTSLPTFDSFELLSLHLGEHPIEKSTILIKGSRGMALERLLDIM